MKIDSRSLDETGVVAEKFLDYLRDLKGEEGAQIAGLIGDLGAGKTTFVQALGRLLGIRESMTSPTFVIEKNYELAGDPTWNKLIHIDAYRLQNGEELMKLNFEEIAADPKNLVLIEWSKNVESALPKNYQKIYFKFIDENTREIKY
ncbi:MAG TPA: tRNA (adenosine(37)-N6)-threonylcarbamoyltransferase complex ATPase subunit type 1 TsaE [Candidatus Paceibacterota bacterium]|nr:tRNA (adenosine(37)-N6)-threonylcarbamoyltransferase complex ATPase subunit type 1 TsaE [Candidatus Paceibacterota bacterium]